MPVIHAERCRKQTSLYSSMREAAAVVKLLNIQRRGLLGELVLMALPRLIALPEALPARYAKVKFEVP